MGLVMESSEYFLLCDNGKAIADNVSMDARDKEGLMPHAVATVTSKGQVTIPKEIRDLLDIQEQDQLLFLRDGDRVVLVPLRQRPLSELYKALPATRPFPGAQAIREQVRAKLGKRMAEDDE